MLRKGLFRARLFLCAFVPIGLRLAELEAVGLSLFARHVAGLGLACAAQVNDVAHMVLTAQVSRVSWKGCVQVSCTTS